MNTELVLKGTHTFERMNVAQVENRSTQTLRFFVDNRMQSYVTWGRYETEDGIVYDSYGVQVENRFGVLRKISDISTDGDAVKQLVDRMNKYRISIHQIDDVIQDFLAS